MESTNPEYIKPRVHWSRAHRLWIVDPRNRTSNGFVGEGFRKWTDAISEAIDLAVYRMEQRQREVAAEDLVTRDDYDGSVW